MPLFRSNTRPLRPAAAEETEERFAGPDGLCTNCGGRDCYESQGDGCPTYVCAGCLRLTPWCSGGTDTEMCDDCWSACQKLLSPEEWERLCEASGEDRVAFSTVCAVVEEARAAQRDLGAMLHDWKGD